MVHSHVSWPTETFEMLIALPPQTRRGWVFIQKTSSYPFPSACQIAARHVRILVYARDYDDERARDFLTREQYPPKGSLGHHSIKLFANHAPAALAPPALAYSTTNSFFSQQVHQVI